MDWMNKIASSVFIVMLNQREKLSERERQKTERSWQVVRRDGEMMVIAQRLRNQKPQIENKRTYLLKENSHVYMVFCGWFRITSSSHLAKQTQSPMQMVELRAIDDLQYTIILPLPYILYDYYHKYKYRGECLAIHFQAAHLSSGHIVPYAHTYISYMSSYTMTICHSYIDSCLYQMACIMDVHSVQCHDARHY